MFVDVPAVFNIIYIFKSLMLTANQNPEQITRDPIDRMFLASGGIVQSKSQLNLGAGKGAAAGEYQTYARYRHYLLNSNLKLRSKHVFTFQCHETFISTLRDSEAMELDVLLTPTTCPNFGSYCLNESSIL